MTRVRVRGIYSTALTRRLLDAGLDVVDASPPIRERFDAEFRTEPYDIDVSMTPDRQGVGVSGPAEPVDEAVQLLESTGIDTFVWPDRAARGAVFNGVVERTAGGGAIVALADDHEGYLPFDAADQHVEEGDHLRVQVHEPNPWWDRDRPVLGTQLRAIGGLADLERGVDSLVAGTPDGSHEHELARTTELLATDVPENWGVYWHYAAEDASMDTLGDALDGLVRRANQLEEALADAPRPSESAPYRVVAPERTVWTWFGRQSRASLDDARREVTATMPGHHRIKAAHEAASGAVDFAESLGVAADSFPFGAVTDQFGPTAGDLVEIQHGKPDGRLITIGRGEVVERDVDTQRVTVRREMSPGGAYDALGVERERGDIATTRFVEGRWWYPTVYEGTDGQVKGTYLNVSTPVEVFPDAVRYVDLHVDVVKHGDGTVELVDEAELQECVDCGYVDEDLAEQALDVAERVRDAVEE